MRKTIFLMIVGFVCFTMNFYSQEKVEKKGVWIGRKANERVISREFKETPENVRRCHAQGTFIVRVLVNKKGRVEDKSLVKGICKKGDEFVLQTVASWKFNPLVRDKEIVYFRGLVTINFWYGSIENAPY